MNSCNCNAIYGPMKEPGISVGLVYVEYFRV